MRLVKVRSVESNGRELLSSEVFFLRSAWTPRHNGFLEAQWPAVSVM